MIITKELLLYMYEYIKIDDIPKKFEYLDEISKKLNINVKNLVEQIKEIDSKNLYEEKKEKDLNFNKDTLKTLFELFIKNYKNCEKIKIMFLLNEYNYYSLGLIKSIVLKDYYISISSDRIRLYKKENNYENNSFYRLGKEKYIDLYGMNINFHLDEMSINDILEISNNVIIVLFINFIFIFNIENDNFNMIKYIKENKMLLKCSKYNEKIMICSTSDLIIYEKKDDFSLQKVTNIKIGKIIVCSYFFNNIIVTNDKKYIRIFSIDKKCKLSKIKNDYFIKNDTRIKICYMKKIKKFILLEDCLCRKKLILTDFDKTFDEIIISSLSHNIQEYSKDDEFLVLELDYFSKYKIENNKFKFVFQIHIIKVDKFQDNDNIFQISDDLYLITGMNVTVIYKYNKKDEVKEISFK